MYKVVHTGSIFCERRKHGCMSDEATYVYLGAAFAAGGLAMELLHR